MGRCPGAAAVPSVVSRWTSGPGNVHMSQLGGIHHRLSSATNTISFAPANTAFVKRVVGELGSYRSSVPVWFALAEKSQSAAGLGSPENGTGGGVSSTRCEPSGLQAGCSPAIWVATTTTVEFDADWSAIRRSLSSSEVVLSSTTLSYASSPPSTGSPAKDPGGSLASPK